jgi:hypothetical protein
MISERKKRPTFFVRLAFIFIESPEIQAVCGKLRGTIRDF